MIQKIKKQNVFIIPDIHGCYLELEEMLKNVPKNTLIIFLGDYIDRGDNSMISSKMVMELVKSHQAIALKGNHESMLLNSIGGLFHWHPYIKNGGNKTLLDFTENYFEFNSQTTFKDCVDVLNEHYADTLDFFSSLPVAIEMDDFLFVHAGVPDYLTNLKDLYEDDALWIREDFYLKPHQLPHKIFFGHTPIMQIDDAYKSQSIWFDTDKTKFGLDGGCVFGFKLNGVLLNVSEGSLQVFQTWKENNSIRNKKMEKIIIPNS